MSDKVSLDTIADSMFKLVNDGAGMKKYKAMDLQKAMKQMYPDQVDQRMCKEAIKILINSGRLVYTYFGGSFIEIPHKEGSANP